MTEVLKAELNSLVNLISELRSFTSFGELLAFIESGLSKHYGILNSKLILIKNGPLAPLTTTGEHTPIWIDRDKLHKTKIPSLQTPQAAKVYLNDSADLLGENSSAWILIPLSYSHQLIGLLCVLPTSETNELNNDVSIVGQILAEKLISNAFQVMQQEKTAEVEACHDRIETIVKELNNLEQIKSDFISVASHELRTPLTVTRGYVEILLEDGDFSVSQKKILAGVYKGVLKQEEILDSLFELAKFDTVSPVLNQESISIGRLCKELVKKFSTPIQERDLKVTVEVLTEEKAMVDNQSIWKLLLNLIQNAIKFTPDHGEITIRVQKWQMALKQDREENGLLITIKDSGVGIEHDQLETIFTRFYYRKDRINTHSSGKTKFKGSGLGLGLALSRAIAQAHGGWVWAESPGYDEIKMPGSEFKVFLPIKK